MKKLNSLEESDLSSDKEKILAAYDQKRARHFLDNILMPLLRKAVKQDAKQDVSCSPEKKFAIIAIHGASVEDDKYWSN